MIALFDLYVNIAMVAFGLLVGMMIGNRAGGEEEPYEWRHVLMAGFIAMGWPMFLVIQFSDIWSAWKRTFQ